GYARALAALRMPLLVVGSLSDMLYPPDEQRELAWHVPGADLAWLDSPHGHDAFLIETPTLDGLIRDFRRRVPMARSGERNLQACRA
ncbi:MAG TPA: hypothetical protein VGS99_05195, partial [Gammaproteobacteria bacterium]|nr:hypothetical protein [Gammaproteobacteria bacterium]